MRSVKKRFPPLAALVALAGMLLSGCAVSTTGATNSFDASEVECTAVDQQLEDAEKARDEAEAAEEAAAGKPNHAAAVKDREAAISKLSALQGRLDECGKVDNAETAADDDVEDFVIDMPRRENNRLNADGVEKRGNAEAFRDQIAEQAKRDPLTLYLYYMKSPLGEKRPLENEAVLAKDGRIEDGNVYSERGIKAYEEWLFLWELTDIDAVDEVRFQGANTGVEGTRAVQSDGVSGDDKSGYDITYFDASGKKVAEHSALNRCTQPTTGKPSPDLPPGKTDNPPKKNPPKENPPKENPPKENPPTKPGKKSSDDPYPKGNAPVGGGKNADPGPGKYVEPEEAEQHQPPSTPRTNPPKPAPEPKPSSTPKPPVDSTPDPVPPPPVETAAPKPEAPAEGCSPPPGMTTC